MHEDDFLVDAAECAGYYERANKLINDIVFNRIADRPSQEIIDDPDAFKNWVAQCERMYQMRNS